MDITKIAATAIISVLLSLLIKKTNPAAALCIVIACGIYIISTLADELSGIIGDLHTLLKAGGVSDESYKCVIKVTGIAYFTEITSGLCRDAGENALAAKLDIAGRICILSFTIPVIAELLEVIISAVTLI